MTSVYRGVIANYGFIQPREFLKMDEKEIALLDAILIDTQNEMQKLKK
nr:MAG TPA: hypothetical protein [Caudoviricetes sp.]